MHLRLALFAGLFACSSPTPAPQAPAEAPPAPAEAPAAPGAPATLAEISGEWFAVADQDGRLVSRDWCEADRLGLDVKDAAIILKFGQEASVEAVASAASQDGALAVETQVSPESRNRYTIRYADASHKELIWEGAQPTPWRLSRKEPLLADGRFLVACCSQPADGMPTEVGLVPEGQDCPAQ